LTRSSPGTCGWTRAACRSCPCYPSSRSWKW